MQNLEARVGATLVDRIGQLDDPHRVDIFRHQRKRGDTFELRWRRNGVRDCQGSYEDIALAHTAATHVHSALRQGLDLPIGRHARVERRDSKAEVVLSLSGLADLWLAQHPGKIRTREGHRDNFKNYVLPELPVYDEHNNRTGETICLAKIAPNQLTRSDINIWKKAVSYRKNQKRPGTTISSSTVKAALVSLTACLSWAESEGLVRRNEASGVKHDVYGARKPEWFRDEDEFWLFISHCPEWSRPAFVCAIYAGARFGELAALQVEDIDLNNHRITFIRSVDSKHRVGTVKQPTSEDWVALHPVAERYLREHIEKNGRLPGQTVFFGQRSGKPLQNSSLRTALQKGLAGARLDKHLTLHGSRHSTATWLRKAGVDAAVIQKVMRHADLRTTAIYMHVDEEERVDAINALRGPRELSVAAEPEAETPQPKRIPAARRSSQTPVRPARTSRSA